MDLNRYSDRDPSSIARSTPDHWVLFLIEGVALILLGLLAVAIPSIANENVTGILGWLFLLSGATGLVTTYWARQAPGFLWSLVSALLAIFVGVVLIENKSQDLYGGLLGWPFHDAGPLRLILVLFFLVEGGVSIMFGIEHRRYFSTRWAFMFASGVVDIVLASIIIFVLPGTSAWTLGLLIGINMIFGGSALVATGLHARTEWAVANEIPLRSSR
ncbi:MAG: DUF308 domain-containing protein [Xanthobacteraceae bacterium]|jgi:uncharacterized membrane protein HdeD (DUF308 family)